MFCFFQMLRILKYHHLVFARTGIIPGNTLFLLIKHSFSSFRGNFERGVGLKNYWCVKIYTVMKFMDMTVQSFFANNDRHVRDSENKQCWRDWQFIYRQVMIKQDPPTPIKKTQS